MPIVESPTFLDWPPLAYENQVYGHFVLFRFDNLASVAILDDEEASRAASLLPQDWYLGLVLKPGSFHLRNAVGTPLLDFHIYLLGVGPADPISACIPITPAPRLADDHPPIELPASLPWPNLYVHSYHAIKAVISRIHFGDDYFPASLTEEQQLALMDTVTNDIDHRYDAAREAAARSAVVQSSPDNETNYTVSDSDSEESDSDVFMLSDEAQSLTAIYQRRYNYGELWLDPTACPGLPADPAASEEMFRRLHEIGREWYERKLEEARARRPQRTREWIEAVENASAGSCRKSIRKGDIGVSLGGDDILPEDAVDSRLEQLESGSPPPLKLFEPTTIAQASFDQQAGEDSVVIAHAAKHGGERANTPTTSDALGSRAQFQPPQATPVESSRDITKAPTEQRAMGIITDTGTPSITTNAISSQPLPAKRSSIAPNWLVSAKRTTVSFLRSVIAHVKARTPHVSVSVAVRRRERVSGVQA